MGRNKRLRKGIASLEAQHRRHGGRLAEERGSPHPRAELIRYWEDEIGGFERELERKGRQVARRHGR